MELGCSVLMLAAGPAEAQDPLLLQQALLPDEVGTASMLVDRDRVLLVRAKKAKGRRRWWNYS